MPLIRVENGKAVVAADVFAVADDDAALPEGAVIVSLARFQKERETLLARNAPLGVRLKSSESPELLGEDVQRLSLVVLEFPAFRDGRGFSWSRMLRTRFGFTGEIRAVGDFLFDQLSYMVRTGIDGFDAGARFTPEDFAAALGEMSHVYQPSADGKKTIRQLRAGR